MSIIGEILSGVVDTIRDQAIKEIQRVAEGINRRIGQVPKGRKPIDAQIEKAKRDAEEAKRKRAVLELDEIEPRDETGDNSDIYGA